MRRPCLQALFAWLVAINVLFLAACGGDEKFDSATFAANTTLPLNAFTANLTGAQALPLNVSTATATGVAVVDPESRVLRAVVITTDVLGVAVHIAEALPGLPGPVIFSLEEIGQGSGIWTLQVTLTVSQLDALRAGNLHFRVDSPSFPFGEIRGQILPQLTTPTVSAGNPAGGVTTVTSVLTGGQQVPPTLSPATALGVAAIDPLHRELTAAIVAIGIVGTEASIRQAPRASNGPLVFPLAETFSGSGIWVTRTRVRNEELAALVAGSDYFEVRSIAFPNGEIRGQIGRPD